MVSAKNILREYKVVYNEKFGITTLCSQGAMFGASVHIKVCVFRSLE